jgi:hypothetical protein
VRPCQLHGRLGPPDTQLAEFRDEGGQTVFTRQGKNTFIQVIGNADVLKEWQCGLIVANKLAAGTRRPTKPRAVASFERSSLAGEADAIWRCSGGVWLM